MRSIADLHIHSLYSRATSKEMNIVSLTKWAQIKGTNLIGTGDFTHPKWFEELQEKLEPAEPGLFKLKPEYEEDIQAQVPESCRMPMRFMLSAEVSTIYKKNGATRKIHSLLFAPSFENVAKINEKLGAIGNLGSDGRPIIGLDTKELFQIVREVSEDNMLIPAHVWTPHFSVFGSQSGFDSLEECFEELTPYISAIETGLSSDLPMNWRIEEFQNRAIISNSDAHSPRKLGREATIMDTDHLSYYEVKRVLEENDTSVLKGTIEFYPEEGKYHYDGHRKCGLRLHPRETLAYENTCPQCGKKLTVGVMHRVENLATYPEGHQPAKALPQMCIIPLADIISNVEGKGVQSKHVTKRWWQLIVQLGDEFSILLDRSYEDIAAVGGAALADAVEKMREGNVRIEAGYDGEYGTIALPQNSQQTVEQGNLL